MTQEEKLINIIDWYSGVSKEETGQLTPQKKPDNIQVIEVLIDESFPQDILNYFNKYDGDSGSGHGPFLGHSLIGLDQMKYILEYAKTRIKPENPKVSNPEESNAIIEKLIKPVVNELPVKHELSFIKPTWFKVEFACSPDSIGGPYFYPLSGSKERKVIRLSDNARREIFKLAKQLHTLELRNYHWDNLEITVYSDGQYEVKRTYYDFDNQLPLTSTPDSAIKKKYFHIKWIPIISDCSGNYIGIDLDPDKKGTRGQVIIFGRDEEDMLVLANSWGEFLDYNLQIINKGGEAFKTYSHLHDIYKKMKGGQ